NMSGRSRTMFRATMVPPDNASTASLRTPSRAHAISARRTPSRASAAIDLGSLPERANVKPAPGWSQCTSVKSRSQGAKNGASPAKLAPGPPSKSSLALGKRAARLREHLVQHLFEIVELHFLLQRDVEGGADARRETLARGTLNARRSRDSRSPPAARDRDPAGCSSTSRGPESRPSRAEPPPG